MADVVRLTFNPFQENTYIVFDETGACAIFDPGCYQADEEQALVDEIEARGLRPERLINTHCHLDHVFGNAFVAGRYGLPLEIHRGELTILRAVPQTTLMYGLPPAKPSPEPGRFLEEGEVIEFGNTRLKVLLTPGHSPASLCFFCAEDRFVIAGDVLFYGSIGRTDFPGSDHGTLLASIREKLFPLGDDVIVYPGHGPATRIGFERENNPFLTEDF